MSSAWKSIAVLVLLAAARSPAADPPPVALPLTQFEVLGLVQQGIGDEAVVAKLRETGSTFRLSASDRQMLKALGVSDRVLAAMAGARPPVKVPFQRTVEVLPDGSSFERIGIDFNAPPPKPAAPAGPVGTWYRHVGPMLFVLKVGPDHLTATVTQSAAAGAETVAMGMTFCGDYALSKDGGTLHGLITGVDVVTEGNLPDGDLDAMGDQFKKLGAMADQPFALSFRVQDGELAVRNVRVAGPSDAEMREPFEMMAGRYKSAGDKPVPRPKPVRPQQSHVGGMTLPSPQYLVPPVQYIPSQFPQAPAQAVQQLPPPPLPPSAGPLLPAVYPDAPPPTTAAPQPVPTATPAPPPVPSSPAGPKPVGTWVREFDGMQVVLKLTDKRLFATMNVAYVEDGKPGEVRMTFRADADYAVGPDGTLFGVVTGTDYTPPKGDDADPTGGHKMMAELNGTPFCFRYRIDEGVLSVRDLRCGALDEAATSTAVLGRYARTEKEPAPPKAVKMPKGCDGPRCRPPATSVLGGMTLPGPCGYLNHHPQYFPPDPPFPLQRELNTLEEGPMHGAVPLPTLETAPLPRPVPIERLHGGVVR